MIRGKLGAGEAKSPRFDIKYYQGAMNLSPMSPFCGCINGYMHARTSGAMIIRDNHPTVPSERADSEEARVL